jgi:hypothetical protein
MVQLENVRERVKRKGFQWKRGLVSRSVSWRLMLRHWPDELPRLWARVKGLGFETQSWRK